MKGSIWGIIEILEKNDPLEKEMVALLVSEPGAFWGWFWPLLGEASVQGVPGIMLVYWWVELSAEV